MEIRAYDPTSTEETEVLRELAVALDIDVRKQVGEAVAVPGEAWFQHTLKESVDWIFLAWEETKPVGFIAGKISEHVQTYWHICKLYVCPEFRWQWYSSKLIEYVECEFRKFGMKHITISAYAKNELANTVYRKKGFEVMKYTYVKRL